MPISYHRISSPEHGSIIFIHRICNCFIGTFCASVGASCTPFLDHIFLSLCSINRASISFYQEKKQQLHGLETFVGVLCDIKSVVRVEISFGPGGMKTLCGLAMYVSAKHYIEYSALLSFPPQCT